MRSLRFVADEQQLTYVKERPIVAGTQGYLRAAFELSKEWEGLRVVARFFDEAGEEHAELVDEAGECVVPSAATRGCCFRVSLMGAGDYVLTTNKVMVRQEVL